MTATAAQLTALSRWIDEHQADRDPEAVTWGRVSKIGEEFGEVIEALIGATGQNPRKGHTHDWEDVEKELLDVALTALGAVVHLHDVDFDVMDAFDRHVGRVHRRAGLGVPK